MGFAIGVDFFAETIGKDGGAGITFGFGAIELAEVGVDIADGIFEGDFSLVADGGGFGGGVAGVIGGAFAGSMKGARYLM